MVVSDVHRGVVNTHSLVSDVHQGVSELQRGVTDTHTVVSDIHRIVVQSQERTDGKNQSVSRIASNLFIAEPTLTTS